MSRSKSGIPSIPKNNSACFSGLKSIVSGTYELQTQLPASFKRRFSYIELRLDIDGRYPQNVVSCSFLKNGVQQYHFFAKLSPQNVQKWKGTIEYTFGGNEIFKKEIAISIGKEKEKPSCTLKISLLSGTTFTLLFVRTSKYFHPVRFEYDRVKKASGIIAINPQSHPFHPKTIRSSYLSLRKVFQHAGFDVSLSRHRTVIPIEGAGDDKAWDRHELHEAMVANWKQFKEDSQWSLWVLFANKYADDNNMAGIMFDHSYKNQRRGAALFDRSPIYKASSKIPDKSDWKERMLFWAACHEIGHLFNLSHTFDRPKDTLWIPMEETYSSFSFMNYPRNVKGGKIEYFKHFAYRFDDEELLFMRHAPEQFVKMGNTTRYTDAAYAKRQRFSNQNFTLTLRLNRPNHTFTFMEPVIIECKLKNTSTDTQKLHFPSHLLADNITVVVMRKGNSEPHYIRPYARHECCERIHKLSSGASYLIPYFLSADATGWLLDEPGEYRVRACCTISGCTCYSKTLRIKIKRPESSEMEHFAQDYFTDEVGRIFAFNGSKTLVKGIQTLQECVERKLSSNILCHARLALAAPHRKSRKFLTFDKSGRTPPRIQSSVVFPDYLKREFEEVLFADSVKVAETLGNLTFRQYMDEFSAWLRKNNFNKEALQCKKRLYTTLKNRNVKKSVLLGIKKEIAKMKI